MTTGDADVQFEPPPFPNLLQAFQQTLSMSRNLSFIADRLPDILNSTRSECSCRQASETNWTYFNEKIASVPETLLSQCDSLYDDSVATKGYVSSGLVGENRALIIGISSGVVVAIFIVVCVLLLFR